MSYSAANSQNNSPERTPMFTARSRHIALNATRHSINIPHNAVSTSPAPATATTSTKVTIAKLFGVTASIGLLVLIALHISMLTNVVSLQAHNLSVQTGDVKLQQPASNNVYYVKTSDGYIETQKINALNLHAGAHHADAGQQHNAADISAEHVQKVEHVPAQQPAVHPAVNMQIDALVIPPQPERIAVQPTQPPVVQPVITTAAKPIIVETVTTTAPQKVTEPAHVKQADKPALAVVHGDASSTNDHKLSARSKQITALSQKAVAKRGIYANQTLLPHNEETRTLVKTVADKPYKVNSNLFTIKSPNEQLQLSVTVDSTGKLMYAVDDGKSHSIVKPSVQTLNVDSHDCTYAVDSTANTVTVSYQVERGYSYWRPVPAAERAEYDAHYMIVKVWCAGKQCNKQCNSQWTTEFRLYDYGFATRALILPSSSSAEAMVNVNWLNELQLPEKTPSSCIGSNFEEPYTHVNCSALTPTVMTPVTMETYNTATPYRHIAILQASGVNYMGATVGVVSQSTSKHTILQAEHRGEAYTHPTSGTVGVLDSALGPVTPTSWHVLLLATQQSHLIEHNYLVPLLCEPVTADHADTRWVATGKSLRVRSHTTAEAKQWVDFAVLYNYQLVHFDAGWYGNEYDKKASALAVLPALAVALDVKDVTKYAKKAGIQVSMYVNDLALRDTDKLIKLLPKWGVNGIKFGFVDVEKPSAITLLHQRIVAYGQVGVFVNVHDAYRPRGLQRTYPWLISVEGVRGEERKPDATHHTYLPFVRTLQGSADYTPRYLTNGIHCTHAHQLALPIVVYNQIQSLFWAEPYQAVLDAYTKYMPELTAVWSELTTTWDDTRVLSGHAGEWVSIARRHDYTWYIGTITNNKARSITLLLQQLFESAVGHPALVGHNNSGYIVSVFNDAPHTGKTDMFAVKVMARKQYWLASTSKQKNTSGLPELTGGELKVHMAPSGGNVVIVEPVARPADMMQISTL